jgi:Chaperone required for the assembly of the mitochondrial F1-ATPase
MKRFWKEVAVIEDGGFGIALDGRPVKTPARADLALPTRALADAIAAEWLEVGETIDPRSMPLTGLANAAVDRIAMIAEGFAADLAKYGESDLLCYRADSPAALADREEASWGPLLAWARRRFDVDFEITSGITHVPQPPATVERLAHAVAALDPMQLAGLSQLVTISGSLVTGLAVADGHIRAEDAWDAVTLDERWQAEQWGSDAEAEAALANKRRDFMAAARFLELLG